ncbi:MAG: hypothetical protein DRJ03_28220 [Chloroflexi bacterium]|nr:MAG: hypothetical protein DRI81_16130 [Chloroflexota bacterium]RLC76661.1 MAG: hypothetical protein DRJ03_28220 [Chloroflexota bacterium]HEY74080.1 hypothetical protein [Thermoflexia bacterium]
MSKQETMTVDEKRKYLRIVKPRYKQAGRNEVQAREIGPVSVKGLQEAVVVYKVLGARVG